MPRMGSGSPTSPIMIVGECFSHDDGYRQEPFSGADGAILNSMLHEAGLMRTDCYCTNVVNDRPPGGYAANLVAKLKKNITVDFTNVAGIHVHRSVAAGIPRLIREVNLTKPNIIIAMGTLPLWVLTGAWGVNKWRGSQLMTTDTVLRDFGILDRPTMVIPVCHPSSIRAQWDTRPAAINDLRRVRRHMHAQSYNNIPAWSFTLRPSYTQVTDILDTLTSRLGESSLWVDFDLETRAGHIACAGISWSRTEALCIPFMCVENHDGYWSLEEEAALVYRLYKLLTHPNVKVRGQNLLYDAQYTYRHWHFVPRVAQDTMISHHTMFAGLPKRLDYQASLYCDHYVYWKDDGKTWTRDIGEDQLWSYNCVDCVRTREGGEVLLDTIASRGMVEVEAFQQKLFWPVLQAMQRGVRIDKKLRAEMAMTLMDAQADRETYFQKVLGHPLNPNSSPQMVKLFYDDLGLPPIKTRAKKGVPGHLTCDDSALNLIKVREPILRPLLRGIAEYRSLGVFLSTFVQAPLDIDGRMRCSYNICGTETYRFSSSKNAFGTGTNLQNVPKGDEEAVDTLNLPNIRRLFIPDPGYTFFDLDLDRADLQVVAWEANDLELKSALKLGVDMHLLNAFVLQGKEPPPLAELVTGHGKYSDHIGANKKWRQLAKSFIHGTNYGGGGRTMAIAANITTHMADKYQSIYFGRYPGIKNWHARVEAQLNKYHFVENAYGYRRYYFERPEGLLPEGLAWIPQSTVANYIDRIWLALFEHFQLIQVLLQVHDSLAGQFPTHLKEICKKAMHDTAATVSIPYEDLLVIPIGIKTSEVSWGDCE